MDKLLEQEVRRLAGNRCEYCRVPETHVKLKHVFDHIIARQHGGQTVLENLALCCGRCNQFKGPNISGIDPLTGNMSHLFHPRRDRWRDHFRWNGPLLVGTTSVGRTTVAVLSINLPLRVVTRRVLIDEGVFPPTEDARREGR